MVNVKVHFWKIFMFSWRKSFLKQKKNSLLINLLLMFDCSCCCCCCCCCWITWNIFICSSYNIVCDDEHSETFNIHGLPCVKCIRQEAESAEKWRYQIMNSNVCIGPHDLTMYRLLRFSTWKFRRKRGKESARSVALCPHNVQK